MSAAPYDKCQLARKEVAGSWSPVASFTPGQLPGVNAEGFIADSYWAHGASLSLSALHGIHPDRAAQQRGVQRGGGVGSATITVTLSAISDLTVTVEYATSDGTAVAPGDYTESSGALTFTPGLITRTFTVPIADDSRDEADETVLLALSDPDKATLGTPYTATLTIVDNDYAVYLPLVLRQY